MVIILSGMLFVGGVCLSEEKPGDIHHEQMKDCRVCHSTYNQSTIRQSGRSCQRCHDKLPTPGEKQTVQNKTDGYPRDSHVKINEVRMYYPESRIGPEPNSMVLIPAGPFTMGTNDRLPDEGPEHTVTLGDFYMDIYEVTNLQYKLFIDATGRRSPDHFRSRTFPSGKADHPVVYVTWYDADAYCNWAGKRLPTQEEWEKAARGTDARPFPWGRRFDINAANTPLRWSALGQEGDTTPVGSFPDGMSPYGIHDMSGNVWEWTSSWYKPYPGSRWKSENYGELYKVLKGGSWWDCSFYQCGISAPVYNRSFFQKRTKNASFGFRCARDGDKT